MFITFVKEISFPSGKRKGTILNMTYKEAFDWIEANKNLIGTKTEKDLLIGDLVAVPTNSHEREVFLRSYVINRNGLASIIPYVNSDLEVWAIDTFA